MSRLWDLLKRHEQRLKRYWITLVELAFDVRNCLVEYVQPRLLSLSRGSISHGTNGATFT